MSAKPSSSLRDEFSPGTKDLLAKRAGFICSYPKCARLTVGPSNDRVSGVSMVGVAAHITAAAFGGPRYDPNLTPEERSSERNGIWVCQIHAKLIDDNASLETIENINRWKIQHEEWIFSRVSAGAHILKAGVTNFRVSSIGVFSSPEGISLGRYNILLGGEGSGKSTFCQALAALAGGVNYEHFRKRFDLWTGAKGNPAIEAGVNSLDLHFDVRISRQDSGLRQKNKMPIWRIQKELNSNIALDWPRDLFSAILLDRQLYRTHYRDQKDTFRNAILYLASVFRSNEEIIWDSFREDLYLNSPLGYRFRRSGRRRVDILVPDGRSFYLPHMALSHSEQSFAIADIALSFIRSSPTKLHWIIIFDTGFFGRLDEYNKKKIVNIFMRNEIPNIQSIVCVNSEEDAEMLRDHAADSWIGASLCGNLTVHSFM